MENNILNDLAKKYGADKWGKHHYTPVYYSLFPDQIRRNRVRKVLEIGAGEGASLRMWRDFFPNAFIYGADNEDNRIFTADRIEVVKCDQTSGLQLTMLIDKVGKDIDLFVDDGSHNPEDQVFTFGTVMNILTRNTPFPVTYVIEDVADQSIDKQIRIMAHNMGFNVELKQVGDRYDDCMIIVNK